MKNLKTLTILLFVAVFSIFSLSCTQEEMDDILGPENTWCRTSVNYKNSEEAATVKLNVYCFYTDKEIQGNGSFGYYASDVTLPAGLTIVVTADSASENFLTGLTEGYYLMKSFKNGEPVTISGDSTNDDIQISASKSKWTALYLAKSDFRKSTNQSTTPLAELTKSDRALNFDNLKDEFSLNKLIRKTLINLLSE